MISENNLIDANKKNNTEINNCSIKGYYWLENKVNESEVNNETITASKLPLLST